MFRAERGSADQDTRADEAFSMRGPSSWPGRDYGQTAFMGERQYSTFCVDHRAPSTELRVQGCEYSDGGGGASRELVEGHVGHAAELCVCCAEGSDGGVCV